MKLCSFLILLFIPLTTSQSSFRFKSDDKKEVNSVLKVSAGPCRELKLGTHNVDWLAKIYNLPPNWATIGSFIDMEEWKEIRHPEKARTFIGLCKKFAPNLETREMMCNLGQCIAVWDVWHWKQRMPDNYSCCRSRSGNFYCRVYEYRINYQIEKQLLITSHLRLTTNDAIPQKTKTPWDHIFTEDIITPEDGSLSRFVFNGSEDYAGSDETDSSNEIWDGSGERWSQHS